MEINPSSPYLPQSNFQNFFLEFKTRVAYRVWRKKLEKYGRFNRNSNLQILDVGCGPGYFLRCAEKWFPNCELYGLDLEECLLNFAAKYLKRARLARNDVHFLPYKQNSFDVVVALQLLEHLDQPEHFLSEARRVLKTKGLLLIATPNPIGIPARILGDKWHGYRYDHISLLQPHCCREIIKDSGFHILEDGTTLLTGFKGLQKPIFAFVNWIPLAIFGYFPWYKGESYMAIATKM